MQIKGSSQLMYLSHSIAGVLLQLISANPRSWEFSSTLNKFLANCTVSAMHGFVSATHRRSMIHKLPQGSQQPHASARHQPTLGTKEELLALAAEQSWKLANSSLKLQCMGDTCSILYLGRNHMLQLQNKQHPASQHDRRRLCLEAVPQEPGEACSLRSCPCSPASFGAGKVDCLISHTFQVGFPAFTGGFYLFHSQYLKFWTLWTCCVNPQLPAAALLHGLALLYSWTHCGDTEVTSVRIPFCSTASENPSRAHQALYACRPLLLLTAQAQQQAYTHPKVALQLGMTNLTASQLLLIPLALSPHWQRLQGRVFKCSNLVYSSEQQQTAEQQDTRKTTTGTLKNEGLRGGQACVQQHWQKRCSGNLLPCTKPSPGSSAECKHRDCSEQQHGTQQTLLIAAFSKVDREQKAKSELLLASWCNLSRRKESCALATFYDCSIWVFKWTNWHNGISQKQIQPQHTSFAGGLFRLLIKELCLRATPLDQQEGAGSTNTKYCMAPRPQHLSCTTS